MAKVIRIEWNTIADGKEGEYITDRLAEESVKFIEQNRNKPFFLYLSHYAVHTPIQSIESIKAKYDKKAPDTVRHHNNSGYAAMIESVDNSMGLLMQTLDRLGLRENTIIIFTSDNGGHGKITSNYLFGETKEFYEGGIRVPLIINWPGITRTSVSNVPVVSMDFYPTILQMRHCPKRSA